MGLRGNFFDSKERFQAWMKLNDLIDEVGRDHLPCRQAPDLFYPDTEDAQGQTQHFVRLAVQACQACPIKTECGEYALKFREEYGVWGGLTANTRRKLWKAR